MGALFAQFSFLIASFGLGCALALGLWRWRRSVLLRAGVMAWYVFGVLIVTLAVRYPPSPYTTPQAVEAALQDDHPHFVMFYSNYCLGCIGTLPAMRAVIPDLENAGITPILLDVNTSPGRDMLKRFSFETTPTYLVFNARGEETLRARSLPSLVAIQAAAETE
jgi:hypothetical protein